MPGNDLGCSMEKLQAAQSPNHECWEWEALTVLPLIPSSLILKPLFWAAVRGELGSVAVLKSCGSSPDLLRLLLAAKLLELGYFCLLVSMNSYSCGTVVFHATLKHTAGVDVGFSCLRFWQVVLSPLLTDIKGMM